MKMFNCAGVLLPVLCLLVVWVNAGVNRHDDCNPNVWDIANEKAKPETACPVIVTPDKNTNRTPPVLYNVKCVSCGLNCPVDYKCTQLKATIKVIYNSSEEAEDYTLYTGCMCAKDDLKFATDNSPATFR